MEQEVPVPEEDLATSKTLEGSADEVFYLPPLE